MKTAVALVLVILAPCIALASERDGLGSVSVEQRPAEGVDAVRAGMNHLKAGMSSAEVLRVLGLD